MVHHSLVRLGSSHEQGPRNFIRLFPDITIRGEFFLRRRLASPVNDNKNLESRKSPLVHFIKW